MIKVIVVEDEDLTRRAIVFGLREQGFDVHEAADVPACRTLLKNQKADVVVLDLGLPGPDGLSYVRDLRARMDVGLVILTRKSDVETRIEALDLGADDYLIKPVDVRELGARLRSLVRRRSPMRDARKRLGRWLVDLRARTAVSGSDHAPLTRGEFDILARLIEANSKIVSRESLMESISRRPQETDLRSVDTLVSRMRRKLGDDPDAPTLIMTAPGFGYRLRVPVEDA